MCLTLLKKVCVGVRPPSFPSRPPSPVVNPMPTLYVILVTTSSTVISLQTVVCEKIQ